MSCRPILLPIHATPSNPPRAERTHETAIFANRRGSPFANAHPTLEAMTVRVKHLSSLQIPDPHIVRYPAQLMYKPRASQKPSNEDVAGAGQGMRRTVDACNLVLPSLSPLKLSSPKRAIGYHGTLRCASPIAKAQRPLVTTRKLLSPVVYNSCRPSPLHGRPIGMKSGTAPRRSQLQAQPSSSSTIKAAPTHRLAPVRPRLSGITSAGLLTAAVSRKPRVKSAPTMHIRPMPMDRQPPPLYCS
jgi:hypothetical protein